MVTVTELRSAYAAAAHNGENVEQLAATLGIRTASLQQNLTSARKDLREIGTTDEELKLIFPQLKRRTGPRTSKRAEALLAMRDAARAIAPPQAPADESSDSETQVEDLSELEALTAPV